MKQKNKRTSRLMSFFLTVAVLLQLSVTAGAVTTDFLTVDSFSVASGVVALNVVKGLSHSGGDIYYVIVSEYEYTDDNGNGGATDLGDLGNDPVNTAGWDIANPTSITDNFTKYAYGNASVDDGNSTELTPVAENISSESGGYKLVVWSSQSTGPNEPTIMSFTLTNGNYTTPMNAPAIAVAQGTDSGLKVTVTPDGTDNALVEKYVVKVFEDGANTGTATPVITKEAAAAANTTPVDIEIPLAPATATGFKGEGNYDITVTAVAKSGAAKGDAIATDTSNTIVPKKIALETLTNTLLTVTPGPTSITLATKGAYATLPAGTELKHSVVADGSAAGNYTKYTAPITALAAGGNLVMSTAYDVYAKVVAITAPTDYSKFYTDGTADKFDTTTTAGTVPTVEGTAAGISKTYSTATALSGNYSSAAAAANAAVGLIIKGSTGNNITAQGTWSYTADSAIVAGETTITDGLTWTPTTNPIGGVTYAPKTANFVASAKKELVASDFTTTGITKVYDGSDALSANVALTSPLNVSGVRNLTVTLTGTYDNKDVDTGKTLTVTGVAAHDVGTTTDTNWAKYYVLPAANTVTGLTGAITAKPVTLTEVSGPISVTLGDIAASDFAGGTFAGTETIDTAYGALTATVGDGSISTTVLAAANDANFKAEFYKLAEGKTDADMTALAGGDPTATTLVKTNAAITTGDYYVLFNAANKNPLGNYNITGVTANSATVASDYVKVTINPAPAGGGASSYTVIYEVGEHGALAEGAKRTESVNYGKFPKKVPAVVANEGYKFLGWSLDGKTVVEPNEQKINKRTTFTALYEAAAKELAFDKEFTEAYIIGMEEGGEKVFKPEAAMTRGEVAVMLARTLNMKMEEGKDYATGKFPDLKGDEWYAQAIGFLAELDVMKGFEDGTCGAEKLISRAEFVTLVMRIDGIVTGADKFPDVAEDNWAREFINAAAAKKYVDGNEYGNFMPTENITRASVVKIMNGVLGRDWNAEGEMIFTDVPAGYWAYNDIMKASTGK